MDTLDTPFAAEPAQVLADRAAALMGPMAQALAQRQDRRQALLDQPPAPVGDAADRALLAAPAQADELLEALPELPVILHVRSPDGQQPEAVSQAWQHVQRLAQALDAPVSEYDSRLDEDAGTIRVQAQPNLVLALVQEQDYFWSVALDDEAAEAGAPMADALA